jgi:curved DNA-binding protein CbpA
MQTSLKKIYYHRKNPYLNMNLKQISFVQKDLDLKDLYKQLSKHTHPDVGGSPEQFREINKLYESEDILGLIVKAEEHDIDLDSIEYSESDLERSCQDLETKCERH